MGAGCALQDDSGAYFDAISDRRPFRLWRITGTSLHPVYEAGGELETLNEVLLDGAEVTEAAKLLLEGVVYSLNSHNVPGLLELKLVEESIKIGLTLLL